MRQEDVVFNHLHRSLHKAEGVAKDLKEVDFDDDIKISYSVLVDIDMSATKIEMESLEDLARMSSVKIRSLDLSETFLNNAGLKIISSLDSLEILNISDNRFNDDGMLFIEKLNRLRKLNIVGNKVTNNGIKHLIPLSSLEDIDAGCTYLGNDGIKTLSLIKSLKYIDVRACGFDDEALDSLQSMPNLMRINISNNNISEHGLKKFIQTISHRGIEVIAKDLIQ
jgi:Leucine-rich repeat (LRR) protein